MICDCVTLTSVWAGLFDANFGVSLHIALDMDADEAVFGKMISSADSRSES